MQIRLNLKNRPRKDGKCLILFDFHLDNVRKRLSSDVYVLPDAWDKRHEEVKSLKSQPNARRLNDILKEKKERLLEAYHQAVLTNPLFDMAFLLRLYNQEATNLAPRLVTFQEFFKFEYREIFRNLKKESTLRKGDPVLTKLVEFKNDLNWSDLTLQFWNEYCDFLISEYGLSGSTIYDHAKQIKIRCKEASKKYRHLPIPSDVEDFNFKYYRVQPFWSTWDEIEELSKVHCIKESEMHIRDHFVLTCNIGVRNSDSIISKQNYQNTPKGHQLRIVINKTGLDFNIPLNKKSLEILTKYDFNIPNYTQAHYNRTIKDLARRVTKKEKYNQYYYIGRQKRMKVVDRCEMFSTHTARRTFGRKWLDEGGSLIILSKLFGHSDTATTLIYVGYTAQEITQEFSKVFSS
jgi:integrase